MISEIRPTQPLQTGYHVTRVGPTASEPLQELCSEHANKATLLDSEFILPLTDS